MTRRPQTSIMANPVLVGAATLLVTLVGVFLAYNANSGLPFVPTYQVTARVPDAAELVAGNEVRIGGKRVGAVVAVVAQEGGPQGVYSDVRLELEQAVEPLPADTRVTVRPKSTLGLKYVELTPGHAKRGIPTGGVLPLANAGAIVELDEVLNAFDGGLRKGLQEVTAELAAGVAGRGGDLGVAVEEAGPLFGHLRPVMRALRSRSADLPGFLRGTTAGVEAVAPVSGELGSLVDVAASTFAAVARARGELGETLDRAAPTARTGTAALRTARPVLDDAGVLARALRGGSRLLPRAARDVAVTLEEGTPVLRRATRLGPDLEDTLRALGGVARDPVTRPAVVGLTGVVASLAPTLRRVNPFQTVCNYLGVWTRNASSTIAEGDANGNWFRFTPVYEPAETFQRATPSPRLHAVPYGSVDGECEIGNEPYEPGQHIGRPPGRQPAETDTTLPPPEVRP